MVGSETAQITEVFASGRNKSYKQIGLKTCRPKQVLSDILTN